MKKLKIMAALLAATLVVGQAMPAFAKDTDDHSVTVKDDQGREQVVELPEDSDIETVDIPTMPTCTTPGLIRYMCTDPVHREQNIWHEMIVPAFGHWWDSEDTPDDLWGKVTVRPGCTTSGTAIDYCLICGEENPSKSRTIAPLGHKYDKNGYIFKDKDKIKNYYVVLPADYEGNEEAYAKRGFIVDAMPNCSAEGAAHFVCTVCGADGDSYKIEKDAYKHDWDGWVVEKEATCRNKGVKVRWCKSCASKQREEINTLEPSYKVVESRLLDCYTEHQLLRCEHCNGKVHEDVEKDAAVKSHVFSKKLIKETKGGKFVNGEFVLDNCSKDGKIVYMCDHFNDTPEKHGSDKSALKEEIIKAKGHTWGAWVLRHQIGSGDNELGYWIRECETCHLHEEMITDNPDGPDGPKKEDPKTPNKYAVDMAGVENGAGKAEIVRTEGNEDILVSELFGRVTWVYDLSDGNTFAFSTTREVKIGDKMFVDVSGAITPRGATLKEVQVALTDDAEAHAKGAFNFIAGAKK